MAFDEAGVQPLNVTLYMSQPRSVKSGLADLAAELQVSERSVRGAAEEAAEAQTRFYDRIKRRGRDILDGLGEGQYGVVLVGRPYNTADQGACQNLSEKLRKLGVLAIPIDFLPLSEVNIRDEHPNMYWRSGQDILAAAKIIREDDRLQAIYVTSFSCGPDSFLVSFFRRLMDRKPFLELEMDDHTAEAGIVTRCEAFLDSLNLTLEAAV
jgi:predicted nucleotide-binding protein (sugar kinase/HSP70/actin superfamily)